MSVTTRADSTPQTIPAGPADQYVKLSFDGVSEFPTAAGRTLVVAWVSSDAWPHKATAETVRQKVIDATQGGTAWNAAVEEALKFLLRPPLLKFRADRHLPGKPSDWTERWVLAAPFVTDLGMGYIAEFDCDDGMLVSVEIAKDPAKAVVLDFRELKVETIIQKVDYR